ncbi:MAG: hypothetical protein KY467_12415 [Gemmatimonadetes bacterium]|nr:hypothetical protein [Gemmatimonadota bacterium]
MDRNDTPQQRPAPQQAGGAQAERRYARRIDCAERPRRAQTDAPPPAPPREDAHP